MKRGLPFAFLFIFIFSTVSTLAQPYGYSTSGFAGLPSISEIVTNEWFNAAILFLIVFAFCWFVLQQVFRASKGIALALSMLIALVGSLGVIYAYGPIIGRLSNWLIIAIFIAICALFWFEFRKSKLPVFLILTALALFWLLWAHNQLCLPAGILPHEACIILDTIAVMILVISIIRLLAWLIGKFAKGGVEKNYYFLTIGIRGNGRTNPSPGNYKIRENTKIKVSARANPGAILDHWELDGNSLGASQSVVVFMDNNHTLMAIFTGETKEPEQAPRIRFVARPSRIRQGEKARLLWATMRAKYVGIAAGAKLIAKKGPKGFLDVMPKQTTNYYATAVGPGGSTQAVATVIVEGTRESIKALTYKEKKALPPSLEKKALPPSLEKKALPPPSEINRIKRDLMRVQNLLDREMKKGVRANQQRINKLLAMRDKLMKRLHELQR